MFYRRLNKKENCCCNKWDNTANSILNRNCTSESIHYWNKIKFYIFSLNFQATIWKMLQILNMSPKYIFFTWKFIVFYYFDQRNLHKSSGNWSWIIPKKIIIYNCFPLLRWSSISRHTKEKRQKNVMRWCQICSDTQFENIFDRTGCLNLSGTIWAPYFKLFLFCFIEFSRKNKR